MIKYSRDNYWDKITEIFYRDLQPKPGQFLMFGERLKMLVDNGYQKCTPLSNKLYQIHSINVHNPNHILVTIALQDDITDTFNIAWFRPMLFNTKLDLLLYA